MLVFRDAGRTSGEAGGRLTCLCVSGWSLAFLAFFQGEIFSFERGVVGGVEANLREESAVVCKEMMGRSEFGINKHWPDHAIQVSRHAIP